MLEEVSLTYLVQGVRCQRTGEVLPFHEAVDKSIIDRDTGAYYNSKTGEHLFIVEAIEKGEEHNIACIVRFAVH